MKNIKKYRFIWLLGVMNLSLCAQIPTDPIDEAHDAAQYGDTRVLQALSNESRLVRISAIRQSVWIQIPENALDKLVEMAAGRDPDLAPEAAYAMHFIIVRLDLLVLERHEISLQSLQSIYMKIKQIANDESVRRDIRALALNALAHLHGLGLSNSN